MSCGYWYVLRTWDVFDLMMRNVMLLPFVFRRVSLSVSAVIDN
mgnify:CR=1 FL=1|jgi:hypothetical protein